MTKYRWFQFAREKVPPLVPPFLVSHPRRLSCFSRAISAWRSASARASASRFSRSSRSRSSFSCCRRSCSSFLRCSSASRLASSSGLLRGLGGLRHPPVLVQACHAVVHRGLLLPELQAPEEARLLADPLRQRRGLLREALLQAVGGAFLRDDLFEVLLRLL